MIWGDCGYGCDCGCDEVKGCDGGQSEKSDQGKRFVRYSHHA